MTSSYYQTLGRKSDEPVYSEGLNTMIDPSRYEEVDLTKSVNDEISRVQDDKNRQFDFLIDQYNHMFKERSKVEQLVDLLGDGARLKKQYEEYRKETAPLREFQNRMREASLLAHPDSTETYKWLDSLDSDRQLRVVSGDRAAADSDIIQEEQHYQKSLEAQYEANQAVADHPDNSFRHEVTQIGVRDENNIGHLEKKRHFYRSTATLTADYPNYFTRAADTLKVNIDGQLKTFHEAGNEQEARAIADVIQLHYMWGHKDLAMGRLGRWKKDFGLKIIEKTDALVKEKNAQLGKIQADVARENRAEDLKNELSTNPNYFVDHINLNVGHYGSYKAARLGTAYDVARYAKTGIISRADVESILDNQFLGNDGQMHTVRDYWKDASAIMLNGVQEYEKGEVERNTSDQKSRLALKASEFELESSTRKTPFTTEEVHQKILKLMKEEGISYENVPDAYKNAYTASSVPDEDIDFNLKNRLANGEAITEADVRGIDDPDLKLEWLKKVTGGIDTKRRDKFIRGKVDAKTLNTLGDAGRGDEWLAYQDNATRAFNDAYSAAKAAGAEDPEAFKAGMDAVTDGLDIGGGNESWSEWGGSTKGTDTIRDLGNAKSALAKDPELISSDKPWIGEEPHIKEAIRYTQGRSNALPNYYRNFPQIKRLPNNKVATPFNLMRHRLESLGLLKDGELEIPEDNLPEHLQFLLNKPSPAKTLRVVNDPEYNNEFAPDPEIQELMLQRLRQGAQVSQQYSTLDQSYRTLVNIPPELNDQFQAQVGELPPYLQLNNLSPEVAKAFVEDTLMT